MRRTSILDDSEGQVVLIPDDMRFETAEVEIWRNEETGEIVLSPTPKSNRDSAPQTT